MTEVWALTTNFSGLEPTFRKKRREAFNILFLLHWLHAYAFSGRRIHCAFCLSLESSRVSALFRHRATVHIHPLILYRDLYV